jgi:hypothetical protein
LRNTLSVILLPLLAGCAGTTSGRLVEGPGASVTGEEFGACSSEAGFAAGARGEALRGDCAGEDETAFIAAHAEGAQLFRFERATIAAAQARSDVLKDFWEVKRRIMEAETRRAASSTPRGERAMLASEIRTLERERAALEADIARLSKARAEAERQLGAFRESLAAPRPAETASVEASVQVTDAAFDPSSH